MFNPKVGEHTYKSCMTVPFIVYFQFYPKNVVQQQCTMGLDGMFFEVLCVNT